MTCANSNYRCFVVAKTSAPAIKRINGWLERASDIFVSTGSVDHMCKHGWAQMFFQAKEELVAGFGD